MVRRKIKGWSRKMTVAVAVAIDLGETLQVDHPEMGDMYRSGVIQEDIAQRLNVSLEHGVGEDVARIAVGYALRGYEGLLPRVGMYSGLLNNEELTIIRRKNSKIGGFTNLNNGTGIFGRSPEKIKADVELLSNQLLKNRIEEIRQLRLDYGTTNLNIAVFHVTIGDKSNLADEYLQESKSLLEKYSSLGFDEFTFDQLGAHEIIEIQNEAERTRKKINLEIPIVYDSNRPSIMEYTQGDTKSFVCTVTGDTICRYN